MARFARLVEEFELEPLRGWLLVTRAFDSDDPVAGEQWAREAHESARASGDLDLEFCAASQVGASLVRQGRITEGVAWLDESMAGSLGGEGAKPDTVVWTSCNMMIVSCTQGAEFERAVQWVRAADEFTRRYGCRVPVHRVPHVLRRCPGGDGGMAPGRGGAARGHQVGP